MEQAEIFGKRKIINVFKNKKLDFLSGYQNYYKIARNISKTKFIIQNSTNRSMSNPNNHFGMQVIDY